MRMRYALAVGLALLGSAAFAQEGKDAFGDPLPKGAKARLGTDRMRNLDSSALLMPDGKTILSQTSAGTAIIDTSTGRVTGKIPVPKGEYSVAPNIVSADGKRGVSIKYDGVVVLELETGKKLCDIKRSGYATDGMTSISKEGTVLALGGNVDDKAKDKGVLVRVWNVNDNKETAAIKVAQNASARTVISADGKILAKWGYHNVPFKAGVEVDPETDPNRLVEFWDAATGKPIATARFGVPPNSVALAPDGQTAAISDGAGSIKLFATKTGELKRQLLGRSRVGRFLQFSGDGKAVAATAEDGAIQIWDSATGRSAGVTECPIATEYLNLRGMSFPTSDRLVAFAVRGNAGVVWESPSGKRLTPAGGHTEPISGLCFADGDKEIIGLAPGQVYRWSPTGKELGAIKLRVPGAPMNLTYPPMDRISVAPSRSLVYRQENASIGLYDLATGVQRFSLPTENSYVTQLHFSKDASKVAAVVPPPYGGKPKPGRVLLADVTHGEITGGFNLPIGIQVASAATADLGHLAMLRRVSAEGKEPQKLFLHGFNTATGKQSCEFPIAEDYGNFFLIPSATKDRVLLVSPKDGVVEFDLAAGKEGETLIKGGIGMTIAPVLSDDGKLLACSVGTNYSSEPSSIEVRDSKTGEVLQKFKGHGRPVTALAFSKDGKTLATASSDSTILLWDANSFKE